MVLKKYRFLEMLNKHFFNKYAVNLAKSLLGKFIYRKYNNILLKAQIIETEAYALNDKSSHGYLTFSEKRRALFMNPGTIYMYHSRAGASLNISAKGEGSAVLIKSAIISDLDILNLEMIEAMLKLNNKLKGVRKINNIMSGQTLVCNSMNIEINTWNANCFNEDLFIFDRGYMPEKIIETLRLGIPREKDSNLLYRFIDYRYASRCTKNPLTVKKSPNFNILSF